MVTTSFFGWQFDVVPTKSMEPAFNAGGMVVARPAESQDIKIGDPILFKQTLAEEEALICHRVINIKQIHDQLFFQTKGDANKYPDPYLVPSQNMLGKVILYVPQVGNIAYLSYLHESPVVFMGKELSIALLLTVAMVLTVVSMEVNNMYQWVLMPESKRRQEILKKRNARLMKRRKIFRMG